MNDFQNARSWAKKFRDAFTGLGQGIAGQNSFTIHFLAAICVSLTAIWVQVSIEEYGILLICIALVMALELVNSSLESMARAVTDQYDEHVRRALNIASAAVLVAAMFSAIIGFLILGPKMLG